jgi:hypothetical protein
MTTRNNNTSHEHRITHTLTHSLTHQFIHVLGNAVIQRTRHRVRGEIELRQRRHLRLAATARRAWHAERGGEHRGVSSLTTTTTYAMLLPLNDMPLLNEPAHINTPHIMHTTPSQTRTAAKRTRSAKRAPVVEHRHGRIEYACAHASETLEQ